MADPPASQSTPSGPPPLIIVVSGPGGVGKGTIVSALVERDPRLWLSRSWTTRARRAGESATAYRFVDQADFERRIAEGGFIEWTRFLDQYYGTPTPEKLRSLADLVATGTLRVSRQTVYGLDEAAEAVAAFQAGTRGKIVIRIG